MRGGLIGPGRRVTESDRDVRSARHHFTLVRKLADSRGYNEVVPVV